MVRVDVSCVISSWTFRMDQDLLLRSNNHDYRMNAVCNLVELLVLCRQKRLFGDIGGSSESSMTLPLALSNCKCFEGSLATTLCNRSLWVKENQHYYLQVKMIVYPALQRLPTNYPH